MQAIDLIDTYACGKSKNTVSDNNVIKQYKID